jgi:Helix-turn-helix
MISSFQIGATRHRRVAARFIAHVRRQIQKALADSPDITQAMLAEALGINRSVVNRQIKGHADLALGRAAEFADLLGFEPEFKLVRIVPDGGQNSAPPAALAPTVFKVTKASTSATNKIENDMRRSQVAA